MSAWVFPDPNRYDVHESPRALGAGRPEGGNIQAECYLGGRTVSDVLARRPNENEKRY